MFSNGGIDNRIIRNQVAAARAGLARSQRNLLQVIAASDAAELWRHDGSRDLACWVSSEFDVSNWVARRWIHAAYTLPHLPVLSAAFDAGTLGLDKVVHLCRFATVETEARLIKWAQRVTVGAVRRKAELEQAKPREETAQLDRERYLRYWLVEDGTRLWFEGSFPADQGMVVAKALDRLADRIPDIVDDEAEIEGIEHDAPIETRRADALVAMASAAIANDQDPDRATIVLHTTPDALCSDDHASEMEGGAVIGPDTARRLSCDSRIEVTLHKEVGEIVGVGRASRTPPAWMKRQLRHRDGGCTFSGCESKWFLHAHHIEHWSRGGPTNLENLVLVCSFHHKLVHEYGWNVALGEPGQVHWFRPGGRPYERNSSGPKRGDPGSRL